MADGDKNRWRIWSWPSGGKPSQLLGLFFLMAPLALFCVSELYKAATKGIVYIRHHGDISFADSPVIFGMQVALMVLGAVVMGYFATMSVKTFVERLFKSNQD